MAEISLREYCEQIENAISQGRYAEAVAHGKHILQQYPRYIPAYRLLGKAMLEAGQWEYAADMFRRVLSADPEDMVAWLGMSEIYNQSDELDAAVWHLERGFELAVDNKLVEGELRQLYGRRDGVEPTRVQLTRGALARLYLKGDLLPRAVSEFRALAAEHPERADLSVALAEALWRNEQRLEASEVCQRILDNLPYCLKANLILGEIWTSSGREEGEMYLQRAEALDPDNRMAQELFGAASPLPAREARIAPLEYKPPTEQERPAWMAGVEAASAEVAPLTEREANLVDIAAALEAQIEIPAWLEEIDIGGGAVSEFPGPVGLAELPPEGAAPAPAGEVPEWLSEVGAGPTIAEETPAAPAEEEVPSWLSGLEAGTAITEQAPAAPTREEAPEWLSEIGGRLMGGEAPPTMAPAEQPPDWLAGLREQFTAETAVPEDLTPVIPPPVAAEIPDWLQGLAPSEVPEVTPSVVEAAPEEAVPAAPPPVAAEIPDWLRELAPLETAPEEVVAAPAEEPVLGAVEEPALSAVEGAFGWTAFGELGAVVPPEAEAPAAAEEPALPAWLEGGEMPSGEEALAWLTQLAAGKEEQLRAQIEAESEVRMAEVMGRPKPAAPPLAEVAPPPPPEVTLPVIEAAPGEAVPVAPARAEIPDWLQGLAPSEAPEVTLPVVEALPEEAVPAAPAAAEIPEWLQELAPSEVSEVTLPVVEALPEEAVPAAPPPVAAEIPDWLRELAPLEIAPEEVAAPPAEEPALSAVEGAFGWTAFGEPEAVAPAEMVAPPIPPEWARLEEVEAPPTIEVPPVIEAPLPEMVSAPEAVPLVQEFGWEAAPEVPREEVAPLPVVEEAVVPPEAPPPAAKPVVAVRAYPQQPRDYAGWLASARSHWQASERQEALDAYARLIHAGKFLEDVIQDLEEGLEQWPSASLQRTLGDAYMKAGRLEEALNLYRHALETL